MSTDAEPDEGSAAPPPEEPSKERDYDPLAQERSSRDLGQQVARGALRRVRALGRNTADRPLVVNVDHIEVTGDFVANDKHGSASSKRKVDDLRVCSFAPLPCPPFTRAPLADDLAEVLQERQLAICVGPRASGLRTAAAAALASVGADPAEIDPSCDLRALTEVEVANGSCLLLDLRGRPAADIGEFPLRSMLDLAASRSLSLVLIVDERKHVPVALHPHVVDRAVMPQPVDVVLGWMRHAVPSGGSPLAAEDDVRQSLSNLATELSLVEARLLGCLLAAGLALEAAIEQMQAGRATAVRDQLGGVLATADTEDAALFLATLVLSGLPETTIVDASERLAQSVRRQYPDLPAKAGPFSRPMSARLDALGLVRRSAEELSVDGTQSTTIALRDPSLSELLLRTAWFEFDIRHSLLEWLTSLIESSGDDLVSAAATAIAQLFTAEPHGPVANAVLTWAACDDGASHLAAATAIGISAILGGADAETIRLVRKLSSGNAAQRLTAAASVQAGVAARFPRLGFSVIDRCIHDQELVVQAQAMLSLAALFHLAAEGGAREFAAHVRQVVGWARQDGRRSDRWLVSADALNTFVHVLKKGQFCGQGQPLAAIAPLLAEVLDNKPTRLVGKRVVMQLLKVWPRDELGPLAKVLDAAAPSERSAQRMDFYLRSASTSSDKDVADAGSIVLSAMEGSRNA